MGRGASKIEKEEIIIAQNGAGNSAAASETVKRFHFVDIEGYLILIVTILLTMIGYFLWKRCKRSYGSYIRRELREMPISGIAGREERGQLGLTAQQVIV